MDALNQEYFDRPESRRLAAGETIDRISAEASARRAPRAKILTKLASNGGILNPSPVPLPTGTTLIRFSRGPFIDQLAGGEWWLDMENNRLVEAYADRNNFSIQQALSRLCAVPAEWNDMTLKVQFITIAPLAAFKGIGKDAFYEKSSGHVRRSPVDSLDGRKVRRRALIDRGSLHMPAFEPA